MMKKTIALSLALVLAAGCLAGCGGADSAKEATAATTSTTAPTSATPQEKPTKPEATPVKHDHCGLKVGLDSTYSVGLDETNKNIFTFSNESISGTVHFAPLAELAGDLTSSKDYAASLVEQYGAENSRMGTSTNIAFYVIHENDAGVTVESLYIYENNGWLVKVTGADKDAVNAMVKIAGLCSIDASLIPAN
ncbi:MAG: hypothetical protein IJB11_08670 [Oscillospiraceae bacterium]|nr:hypothetical protein [Oscillospiraceae bacterium]